MGDLGPAFGSILEIGAPVLKRAFVSFASSAAATTLLAVAVCIGCYVIASEDSTFHGVLALGIALTLFAAFGSVLAVKRGVLEALIHGFEKLALGERTTKALFARMLGGDAGAAIQKTAEKVPLDVAEARLRAAVDAIVSEDAAAGFLRRRIRGAALEKVSAVTLARFRDAGARHGGVDLVKVRDELATRIDQLVVDTMRGAGVKLTAAMLGAATALSLIAAFVLG